jgi:hypothetical protein
MRIAVSRLAAESAGRWLGPGSRSCRTGRDPERVRTDGREHRIVFIGRHDTRKGLPVLLRAWPEIGGGRAPAAPDRHRPAQYRLLHSRMRFDEDGIDVLGIVTNEVREAARGREAVRLAGARRRASAWC